MELIQLPGTLTVRYAPADEGQDAGGIEISIPGVEGGTRIGLIGRGAVDPVRTETFVLEPAIDLLFVVDDSHCPSCKPVERYVSAFLQAATRDSIDYRIGVTTTDVGGASNVNGRLLPLTGDGPRVVSPATPGALEALKANLTVGNAGSGMERHLKPIHLALSPPNLTEHNAGFLRPNARLAVLVVSDTKDQDDTPVELYRDFLFSLKEPSQRNWVRVSGVLPTKGAPSYGCFYETSDAGENLRTRQVIAATGGVVRELCDADSEAFWQSLGESIFGVARRFFLAQRPDLTGTNAIEVEVDGVAVPSSSGVWAYDSEANALDFSAAAELKLGSTIRVTYRPQ